MRSSQCQLYKGKRGTIKPGADTKTVYLLNNPSCYQSLSVFPGPIRNLRLAKFGSLRELHSINKKWIRLLITLVSTNT